MEESDDSQLKSAEVTAQAIFEAIADPVFVIDFVEDDLGPSFRYANEAACRLLQRSREEILQMRPGTLDEITSEEREAAYRKLMAEGKATFETLMVAADGSRIPMEIHASDTMILNQRVCVAVARSLVARKEVDRQMREAREAAESANRAKSEFLAVMSHEIRTPLHGVIGFASLLDGAEIPPRAREAVDGIRDSAHLLLALVTDVLDLSRIEAGLLELRLVPVDLGAHLRRIASSFRLRTLEKRLAFHFFGEKVLPPVVCVDSVRIEQVLGNLLGNALKFTDSGGISLEVSMRPLGEGRGSEILFTIRDTGIGIPADQIPRLFNRFSQVDASPSRRYGGSGLGLVISRRLCEMMGGTVTVHSEVGKGSVFVASLVAQPLLPVGEDDLIAEGLSSYTRVQKLRILVAEDNAINQRLLQRMIERLGLSADFAINGSAAIAMAAASEYDLILMDVSMPEINGLDAVRGIRVREQESGGLESWIVAISAGVSESERTACLEAGMNDFLGKPFTQQGLLEVIRRMPRQAGDHTEGLG